MERIRVFLWQVVVGALPTNYLRFSRHVSDNPTCSRCDLHVYETSLHVLHDCPIASSFWNRLLDAELFPEFYTSSLRNWMLWSLELKNPIAGQNWTRVFASGIHYLWRIRNQEIFEGLVPSDDDIFNRFWVVFKSQILYVDCIEQTVPIKSLHVRNISLFRMKVGSKQILMVQLITFILLRAVVSFGLIWASFLGVLRLTLDLVLLLLRKFGVLIMRFTWLGCRGIRRLF